MKARALHVGSREGGFEQALQGNSRHEHAFTDPNRWNFTLTRGRVGRCSGQSQQAAGLLDRIGEPIGGRRLWLGLGGGFVLSGMSKSFSEPKSDGDITYNIVATLSNIGIATKVADVLSGANA